ncbi:MAG: beta-ketoacyl synthase N-terminal-like domain-containing protein, partial [Candidatus Methanomethyliaceae archaeon]
VKDLTRESVEDALDDAGLQRKDLQAAWFANSTLGFFEGQHQVRAQVVFAALGLHGIPVFNVESACAGGSHALHSAWLGVASGAYDCVLAVGSEKLYNQDKVKSFQAISAGTDVENVQGMVAAWRERLNKVGIYTEDLEGSGI